MLGKFQQQIKDELALIQDAKLNLHFDFLHW